MAYGIMNSTQSEVILQYLYKDLKYDSSIDSWLFVSSPWPVSTILAAYTMFIFKLGPKLMKNRGPINVKYIMIFYNLMQILFNSYILSYLFITPEAPTYLWNYLCHPDTTGTNSHISIEIHKVSWYFSVSKIIDLFDTVFFVLRKKQSHISFLHVYHHINMVITCFACLRFIKSENVATAGIIVNSFVHVVMYTYYFLTALGPSIQKYLWWKKYLTRVQIIQFVFGITYCMSLMAFNCTYPKIFVVYILVDIILFLYMFTKFYINTYKQKDKVQ